MKIKNIVILSLIMLVLSSSIYRPLYINDYGVGFGSGMFLAVNYAYEHDYSEVGYSLLAEALERSPTNKSLLQNNYITSLYSGDVYKAIFYAKYFLKTEETEPLAQLLKVVDSLKKRDFISSTKYLKELIDKKKSVMGINSVVLSYILLWSYIGSHEYNTALELAKKMISSDNTPDAFMNFQMAVLYNLTGDKAQAKIYFDKSSDFAAFSYYYTKLAMSFYNSNRDANSAKALYAHYKENNPYSKYIIKDSRDDQIKIGTKFKDKIDVNAGVSEIFVDIAKILFASGINTQAVAYLNLAIFIQPSNYDVVVLLASYYESIKDYNKAIKAYQLIKKDSDLYWLIQVYIARDTYLSGKKGIGKSMLLSLSKKHSIHNLALMILSDLLREDKFYADAIKVYNLVIDKAKPNWILLFARGICYERINEWDKAQADLKMALKLHPDDPDILNYLGYSLIDRDINIDEAQAMLGKALSQRQDDPQIMDSMGWALYKNKKYNEAERYVEKALELLPQDETVNDHLGDIYWHVDRKLEAGFQWRKALKYSTTKKNIDRINHKINYGI